MGDAYRSPPIVMDTNVLVAGACRHKSSLAHQLLLGVLEERFPIILTEAIVEHRLEPGDIGVVVYVHGEGEAFEVEFVTLNGKTAAVLELESHQVRVATAREIPHARPLSAA